MKFRYNIYSYLIAFGLLLLGMLMFCFVAWDINFFGDWFFTIRVILVASLFVAIPIRVELDGYFQSKEERLE